MSNDEQKPKLHIDTGWKAEAQAEKQRLAQQEQQRAAQGGKQGEMPAADFRGLVGLLTTQAISGLGAMADQKSGRVIVDLEGSRFFIDLLGVLEEKTKGNLTDDEQKELTEVLNELRNRFVQIGKLVAQQQSQQAPEQPAPGSAPDLKI